MSRDRGPRSPRQALRWFRAAAEAGDSRAMNQLASRYATGTGVARDDAQAVQLWRKAADAGEVSAMINLAQMYELGLGVPKRPAGDAWKQKATAAGNSGQPRQNVKAGFPGQLKGGGWPYRSRRQLSSSQGCFCSARAFAGHWPRTTK